MVRTAPGQRASCNLEKHKAEKWAALIDNPAFLHVVLAYMACSYENATRGRRMGTPSPRVLYHRGKALQLLRQCLESGNINFVTPRIVVSLIALDVRWPPGVKRDFLHHEC